MYLTQIPFIVYIISLVQMLLSLAYTMSYTIVPIYLNSQNLLPSEIGLISGLSTFTGILGWLPAAKLTKILGEKKLLILSLSGRGISFLLIGIFVYIDVYFLFIIFFLFINTFLMGLNITPLESYLISNSKNLNQNLVYSIYRTSMNAGWAIGPLLGGYLAKQNLVYPFLATSFLILILSIVVFFFFKNQNYNENQRKLSSGKFIIFKNLPFFFFCLNSLNLFVTMSLLITPLSLFLVHNYSVDSFEIGKLFFLNGIMVVFFQIPLSFFIKNLAFGLQLGLFLYFTGFISVGIFSYYFDFQWIYLSMFIITTGEILSVSSMYVLANKYANQYEIKISPGYVSSTIGFLRTSGWAMGPPIAGLFQEMIASPILVWFFSSAFTIFGIFINSIIFYKYKLDFNRPNF